MDGRPWSGLAGRPDSGSEWTRPSGNVLDDLLDGLARDRTRWATAGRQGTAPATFLGRARTRFTSAPGPGSRPRFERGHPANPHGPSNQGDRPPSSDVPSHADRSLAEGPPDRTSDHHGNRLVGRRAVEGGTTGVVPPRGRHPRVAGRPSAAPRPHGRTRDLIPGSELSRVGALEGRRTSREGARAAIDRRRSERARAGAGTSVPEGRYKAMRGAMPTDTRSGRPSAGTRQGPAMPRT